MKKIKTDGDEKVAVHVTLPAPDTTHYAQWAGDTIKYHSDDQIYEFASARVKAALASNKAVVPRCQYCDGTGDVHSIDGEWRGECTECDASNKAAAAQPSRAEVLEEAALICDKNAERLYGGITDNARIALVITADAIRALKDKP